MQPIEPGTPIPCGYCGEPCLLAVARIMPGDPPRAAAFTYHDGKPVADTDEMKCTKCGHGFTKIDFDRPVLV